MSKEKISITKHVFKVSGCLTVSELAETRQIAEARLKRMWPRSTIEYLSEEFSHFLGDYSPELAGSQMTQPKPRTISKSVGRPATKKKKPASVEASMTDTIGTSFSGA